jgi:glyoxylase-like metal-dependent hydrolase (beta-lactamase superfamily II)
MQSWQLGDIEITQVVELNAPYATMAEMFVEAGDEAVEANRRWLEPEALCPETGKVILPVQTFLARTRHHTILIDTCVGCRKSYDGVPQWHDLRDPAWLDRLAAAGVAPEAVDYVFCTHLHVDHCGWNTRLRDGRWVPTFPNARYVFEKTEFAASEAGDSAVFRENVLPVAEAGQALLVDGEFALDDQIWLEPLPGHTAGHVGVNLASDGARAFMIGDLMHSPIQCVYPHWTPSWEHDRELSRRTRRRVLEHHADRDVLVLTAHFPLPSAGHVVGRGEAFWFEYRS